MVCSGEQTMHNICIENFALQKMQFIVLFFGYKFVIVPISWAALYLVYIVSCYLFTRNIVP